MCEINAACAMRDASRSVASFSLQILEITVEFSGLFTELDTIDRLVVASALPFHRDLRSSGHAGRFRVASAGNALQLSFFTLRNFIPQTGLRWKVQFQRHGRKEASKFRHLLAELAHRISGIRSFHTVECNFVKIALAKLHSWFITKFDSEIDLIPYFCISIFPPSF